MSQIVCLKIQTISECFIVFFAHICACNLLFMFVRINSIIHFCNNYRCMNISILTLYFGNHCNNFIHHFIKLRVFGLCINGCYTFQKFIKITIMKRWPTVSSISVSSCNFEISKRMTQISIFHRMPHRFYHGIFNNSITLIPKTVRPVYGINISAIHFDIFASRSVCNSTVL